MSDMQVRCPVDKRTDGLEGCGSTRVSGPDVEGLYDCLDCGLFFRTKAKEDK